MKRLENKVALVTGGSRGIGKAIVKRLAAEGAAVAFTYLHSTDKAKALAREVEEAGGKATAIQADSADENAINAAVSQTIETYGGVDILVNNSAILVIGTIDDEQYDDAAFKRQMAVNITGVTTAVRAAVKTMGHGGRIISIGSVAGIRLGFPGLADYSATKAAVAAYTRGWANDLAKKGITVNTIQPGPIDTDMVPTDEGFIALMKAGIPMGRFGTPDEVAAAVAFFASPEASYITGTTLNIDGGMNA
jgi:3-oxoacyl-[acyl-carrier protein] reductase